VYRLWRDGGFAAGAVITGVIADVVSPRAAIWTVAVLTGVSGAVAAVRMAETHATGRDQRSALADANRSR